MFQPKDRSSISPFLNHNNSSFEKVLSVSLDLVTLGGWRLLGGRSSLERNQTTVISPGKFVRVWRPPQGLPLVVEKHLRGVVSRRE